MIQKKPCYTTSDEQVFAALDAAQRHEIAILIGMNENTASDANILVGLTNNADKIVDILTTTATSKPKARKVNGGKKSRTPKVETVAPTQQLGAQ